MPKTQTAAKRTAAKGTSSKSASSKNTTGKSSSTKSASSRNPAPKNPNSRGQAAGKQEEDSKLQEFFIDELKDILWAEQKLVKTLPKLAKAATSEELQSAFENHLEETKGQVQRLEQVFQLLGEKATAKKCDAMQGITEEGDSVIEDTDAGTSTRDVALILAGQKAEHYEIATYGGLIQIARTLGHDEAADLLEETLEEEKNADQLLTQIAESGINSQASEEDEEE